MRSRSEFRTGNSERWPYTAVRRRDCCPLRHQPIPPEWHSEEWPMRRESHYCYGTQFLRALSAVWLLTALQSGRLHQLDPDSAGLARKATPRRVAERGSEARGRRVCPPSSFLVAAIHEREQQLREITDQLLAGGTDSVDSHLSEIRGFIAKRLENLQELMHRKPAEARTEL